MSRLNIRPATKADIKTIYDYIYKLAVYEKLEHEFVGTEELIEQHIFNNQYAHALIMTLDNQPIGFAVYFFMFSTFYTKPTLYLEDLYVDLEFRGKGYGSELLNRINEIAIEHGCVRYEWSCLDWNTPSREFYESRGAKPQTEWIRYRLDEDGMQALKERKDEK